jgi:subtilisin family serine protease
MGPLGAEPLPAGEVAAPGARLGRSLERALRERIPDVGLAIAVALRGDDLPPPGPARRAAIRARQERVLAVPPVGSFQLKHRYGSLSGFAGWAQRGAIEALLGHSETTLVYLDGRVHGTLAEGRVLIGAGTVEQLTPTGFTGAGVRVAVLDTGIDTNHPHLSDDIAAQQCFCDNDPSPQGGCCPGNQAVSSSAEDDEGHGTSVSGIITSSSSSDPGVARDADIVAVKVLSSTGGGSFSDIAAGLEWVFDNHTALAIKVVNMSLGDGIEYNDPSVTPCSGSNTANAIAMLHGAGVAVFASSGNEGFDDGISFPACVAEAISVGGVYDASLGSVSWCGNASCSTILCTDNNTKADDFVCHSNSDELLDILAPNWRTDTTALGGGSGAFGGTSASSPYAAAEAALLLEADPSLTPAGIRTLLQSHGPSVANPDNGLSFPRSDVAAAVSAIVSSCGDGQVDSGEDCDDGNTQEGDCCSRTCSFEVSGSSCENGDACTTGDSCDGSGSCSAGAPLSCDDGAFCNGVESCDPVQGCQAGTAVDCSDGVTCTIDACNEATDNCDNTPDHSACDDRTFCNGAETCDPALGCQAGAPVDCVDGVACTVDACDEVASACTHAPDHQACQNGLFCDGAEVCDTVSGCEPGIDACAPLACDETLDTCLCSSDSDCSDGLFCNGDEACVGSLCVAGTPPDCSDGIGCTVDDCDELADACARVPDDAACQNGQFCDGQETCDGALGCQAGLPVQCDDGVGCTVDACDEASDACTHTPDGGSCGDGLYCTGIEICDPLFDCQAGSDPCPGLVCDEAIDRCEVPPEVVFLETRTGSAQGATSVGTSSNVVAALGDLYLAAVSYKPASAVASVSGLGLDWSPVGTQCSGRNQTGVAVWQAQGTPSGDGVVAAQLTSSPDNSVIVVARYTNAESGAIGNVVSGNSNGAEGDCQGGTDSDVYSFDLATSSANARVVGVVAKRNKGHEPGLAYTERVEFQSGSGGSVAGIALEDQSIVSSGPIAVDGSFSGDTDWAFIGLELLPASCSGAGCAQPVPAGSPASWGLIVLALLVSLLWLLPPNGRGGGAP